MAYGYEKIGSEWGCLLTAGMMYGWYGQERGSGIKCQVCRGYAMDRSKTPKVLFGEKMPKAADHSPT